MREASWAAHGHKILQSAHRCPATKHNNHRALLASDSFVCNHILCVATCTGCATFRVGNETRAWANGGVLLFDDSFEHEVFNTCKRRRVVFQVSVQVHVSTDHAHVQRANTTLNVSVERATVSSQFNNTRLQHAVSFLSRVSHFPLSHHPQVVIRHPDLLSDPSYRAIVRDSH